MAINFAGYVYKDNGAAVSGADVYLKQVSDGVTEASTTTDSNGYWAFSESDEDRYYVEIASGSSKRFIRWADEISLKEIDVRNNEANTTPAATFTNLTNNASNQVAVFSGANTTRADSDEIYLSFKLANSAGDIEEFARITAEAVDVTDGEEDGQLRFGVAKNDGTITDVFTINSTTGGETSMTLDVSGDLVLDADGGDVFFKDGGTTFGSATNSSGNLILKSGTTTAATFSGANVTFAGTVDATTDFTIGDTVITDGVVTDSTGLQLAANLDINGTADISGDLTLSGGADGALQFTNAGENSIKIPDNQASALIIEEADNAYITFVTSNGSEAITVAKETTFSAGIADSGTIGAGTWEGTDVAVAHGGTGASSLTDGGVLLGSGTNAVTAMAVLADGEMIVGDGTTDPVAESGATLRTSIGVGTGDSPQFTAIELGHASDTTIARSSSGAITVEGTQVLLAGAQTGITTITNSSLVVGRDADNDIDFTTDNNIRFRAGGEDQLTLTDGALTPSSNAIVDLGTDALEFKDAYFDGTLEADTITIGGTNIVTGEVITTLGTITAGTWEGTTVAVDQGGTGATTLNNLITLGTHTTGNYVATITGGTGITSTGATSGEGIAHSLSVDAAQTHITSVGTLGALQVDNLNLNGNTFSSTNSDGDITISGNDGGSTVVAQHIDMSGGGITVFGGGTASAADTNTKIYTANAGPINVIGTSATDTTIAIGRWSNNASGGTLAFIKDRDGTIGDATALADGDELGKIWFGAGDGVQNAYTYTLKTAQFSAYSDGATGNDGSGDPQTPSGFKWETNTGVAAASTAEVMRLDKNGALFLGDTANGNIATQGLTINQGDNSTDEVIALKATNVAHGRITYGETDTFASFKQRTGDSGGLRITSFTDADTTTDSLNLTTYRRGQPNDLGTAAVSDYGAVDVFVTCHNGSNSAAVVDDDKALFSVTRRTSSGIDAAFIVNSTGELHTDAATGLTTDVFDKEDDVMLVRAFDLARDKESDKKTLVKSGWDKFAHKFEDRLVELGILGKKINEGGMLNLTRLLFLHNGAIFQEFEKRQVLEDKVKTLEEKLQAIGG